MAVTQNTYTGNGSTTNYSFTFPYIETTDIKVSVNGVNTTAYTLANATTVSFNTPPANGAAIRIYRDTDDSSLAATFYPGSAIRSQDLNDNFTQNLYVTQEINNNAIQNDGSVPMLADLNMGGYKITNLQGPPTLDTDATNKLYVDTKVGVSGPPGYTNWSYTASGGETVLGGSGPTLEYQVGKEQVYLNGALLQRNNDYTANTGNTVSFLIALTAGDVVQVRCVNYLAANPSASYNYSRWAHTATGGQTLLSGTGSISSSTLSYTVNREQVFINGVLQIRGVDYTTVSSGTQITITPALTVGDIVEVHSNNSI